jgi:hypothetical protein
LEPDVKPVPLLASANRGLASRRGTSPLNESAKSR